MRDEEYIPGTCNIGKKEVAKRRNSAIFLGVLTVVIVALLLLTHADKLWRFLVFFPIVSLVIGIEQWNFKFCVNFGMRGIFNFTDLGQYSSVEEAEMRKADKRKAQKMILTGVLCGLIVTILFYLVP